MKLKRFVAIVISLAMVLSIVPAFSLTVSAADMSDDALLAYAKTTTALFDATNPAPTATNDTDIATAYPDSGLTGTVNNGYLNVNSGPRIQCYIGSSTNGAETPNYINLPSFGAGNDWALVSFVTEYTCAWGNIAWYDIDGNILTALRYGSGDSNCFAPSWGHNGWGTPYSFSDYTLSAEGSVATSSSGSTQVDMLFRNYDPDGTADSGDEYYTVNFYHNGTSVCLGTYTGIGEFNGLGQIALSRGSGSAWQRISMQALKIYAGDIPASSVEVTATYTVDGTTVKTVSTSYDSSAADYASFDEYYYSVNGTNTLYYAAAQNLSESATIEMTALENWGNYAVGDAITANSTPYVVKSANIVPNGNFEYGMNGWYNRAGSTPPTSYSITTSDKPEVSERAALSSGAGGASSTNSIKQGWDIEIGKTYYYSLWVKAGDQWHGFGEADSPSTESQSLVANGGFGTASAWVQQTGVFTATKEYLVFFEGWGSVGLADVEVYEVEVDSAKIANTTIKFVDSSDGATEIATAVTVTGVVGDTIDLTDTSIVPETITYNSNLYSKDSTNATSHTVAGNTDTVTITYTTDAVTSFAAVTATVIEGNDPILPTTITGYTGSGASTDVTVTWNDATGLAAGTHTITGTADGINATPTATVTVLSETFSLADTDVPASSDTTLTFPESISGEFVMEFDYTPSNVQNNWIYISADGALWGSGQIGIGTNNDQTGTLKAQPSTELGAVESGKTYRMLVTGDASTDTYTLVVTHEDGTTWTADSTFRAASDYINSIRMLPNGNTGSFAVTNIKVHNANSSLQTITINATGSVSETTTVKATSAEVAPIPHYDGHIMKTRTISGTTVTATYEATTTSTGSWYMRNNFTDDNWLSQSKYIGSHNAFADTDEVFDNEGGALYGDSATSGSSTYVSKSRAQSVGALDQLNAGVRYFDIRLSRQEDGTFAVTHGPAFENFRDVAITLAQWAKENPGEVIILDFQTVRDALYGGSATGSYEVITDNDSYYGASEGDDNQYVYDALVQLFKDTGLADYLVTGWDQKYGPITNYGEKAVIIPFGKGRAVNCQGSYFTNRSALNNDVTYTEASSYSDIVSNLDSTYSSLGGGATICTIHAYTTPGVLSTASLLSSAASNNPNWINEANFEAWMGYDKGDVFMMNDSVSNIDLYYNKLNSFNRTGSTYSYSANFTRTDNGVTIDGAQANVPYSTKFTVSTGDASAVGALTIGGTSYTPVTAYNVALMQFNTNSVQPTGEVTLTFPQVSDGSTTVDVLLNSDGTEVLATAGVGEAISYSTTSIGNYILATKVAPGVNLTVQYVADGTVVNEYSGYYAYGLEAYNVPAGDFYIAYNGNAYIVNSASAQTYTVSESDTEGATLTVNLTMVSEYAVMEDILVDSDNNVWGINATNENSIFVAASGADRNGPSVDADGVSVTDEGINPATLGSNRNGYLQFPVVDLPDGKAALAYFYVRNWHGNTFANGNTTIRISATAIDDDSWTTLTDGAVYTDTAAPKLSNYTTVMFSSKATNQEGYIYFDVTEMMKAAKEAGLSTITMRLGTAWGAAYIVEREAAVANGSYQGKAAYIDVVDANTVSVSGATKVTKMGTDVTAYADSLVVPTDATIIVYADAPYVTDGTNVYTQGTAIATTNGAEYSAASLGVAMVDGAQVRIGDGVNDDGTVAGNSGLRFITTVNGTDSLAAISGATFGVEITAESSTADPVDIPAAMWQTDGVVFTSALTNLAVSNYNRNFTATPYVSINGTKYYGDAVTRSIYQVASGLLATGYNGNYGESEDTTGTDYTTMPDVLIKVLNGYVNQTGVRLVITDGVLAKSDKYTGSADTFFTVSNASTSGNVYTCTLTAVGDAEINTGLFNTYVRINNNNGAIKTLVSVVDNGDGTYTLTFDGSSLVTE